jgi:hypothetical protein
VGHHTEAFVGIDTSKSSNAIAVADGGRGGEVRYLGGFPATETATRKLVARLAAKYGHLTFCYEAGPTGYGLYRLLKSLGHEPLAKLASAPFAGTRAVMNFSRVYRTLLSAIAAGVYRDAKDFIAGFRRGFRMTRPRLGYRL